jgi:hypothetical protein
LDHKGHRVLKVIQDPKGIPVPPDPREKQVRKGHKAPRVNQAILL